MSLSVNTYLIYGFHYSYDDVQHLRDELEEYMDEVRRPAKPLEEITVLFDGMNGDYVIFGHVHTRSEVDAAFSSIIQVPDSAPQQAHGLHLKALKVFGADILPVNPLPKWFVVSHYR